MKTKEQILKWLDKQPWKGEFYEAKFLFGSAVNSYTACFLDSAFEWSKTAQGVAIWAGRANEYRNWYNSDGKPRSWEEYCVNNPLTINDFYIGLNSDRVYKIDEQMERSPMCDVATMSKELCEAFLAYMKLIQLRNAWIKDCTDKDMPFRIVTYDNRYISCTFLRDYRAGLSFPTQQMANEFFDTFRNLLEIAKPLL